MGDDGLGLHVLRRLQAEWTFDERVQLIDGGTWGMALLPDIEDATRLMFLDAISTQRHAPGTVLLLERDEIPLVTDHNKLSPHLRRWCRRGLALVIERLRSWGHVCTRHEAPARA